MGATHTHAHTHTHNENRKNKNRARKAVKENSSGAAEQPWTSFGLLTNAVKRNTHTHTHTHTPMAHPSQIERPPPPQIERPPPKYNDPRKNPHHAARNYRELVHPVPRAMSFVPPTPLQGQQPPACNSILTPPPPREHTQSDAPPPPPTTNPEGTQGTHDAQNMQTQGYMIHNKTRTLPVGCMFSSAERQALCATHLGVVGFEDGSTLGLQDPPTLCRCTGPSGPARPTTPESVQTLCTAHRVRGALEARSTTTGPSLPPTTT